MQLFGMVVTGSLVAEVAMVAGLPRRWLGRAMLAWLALPLVVYWAMIFRDMATRPHEPDALATAFYGMAILSGVAAVVWLPLTALGFGLGWLLRRLVRRREVASAAVVPRQSVWAGRTVPRGESGWWARGPDMPAPLPSGATMSRAAATSTPRWQAVHVGFANDGLRIGGLDVWVLKWVPVGREVAMLPHPAHPAQIHSYEVYDVADDCTRVRFAAGELSNGVWGFYVPA